MLILHKSHHKAEAVKISSGLKCVKQASTCNFIHFSFSFYLEHPVNYSPISLAHIYIVCVCMLVYHMHIILLFNVVIRNCHNLYDVIFRNLIQNEYLNGISNFKLAICIMCSWRRIWQPTPVFLPGKPNVQRSLAGYSPWGHRVRHNFSD